MKNPQIYIVTYDDTEDSRFVAAFLARRDAEDYANLLEDEMPPEATYYRVHSVDFCVNPQRLCKDLM